MSDKEYKSNLHPKGDPSTTVYPNVKSENILDKDATSYTEGHVPDSSLVSKSLDGITENLENTKADVTKNAKNISSLQSDVTSLKSDNETTKTTIAGLVSDNTANKEQIASNTQNIENLSAVMPTDINVDSDYNLILEHDGQAITGQKNNNLVVWKRYNRAHGDVIDLITKTSDNYVVQNMIIFTINSKEGSSKGTTQFSMYNISKSSYFRIDVSDTYTDISFTHTYPNRITLRLNNPSTSDLIISLPQNKSGTLALTSDLDAKQNKRYIHTVEIVYASNGGYFLFTGISDKNTSIDSIQDLTSVFANRDFGGNGIFQNASLSKIHIGSSITDTTFRKFASSSDFVAPTDVKFTDIFGTSGFTITDNMTAM